MGNASFPNSTAAGAIPRAVKRVVSDQSRTNRETINRLWDVLDDPHLNPVTPVTRRRSRRPTRRRWILLKNSPFEAAGTGTKVPVLLEKSISIIVDVPIREAFEALEAGLCPHRNFALTIRWSRNSHGHSARARSASSFTSSAITQFVTSSPLSSVMIRRSPFMPTICARLCGGRLNTCDLAGFQTVGGFSQTVSDAFPFLPRNELGRVHRPSIPCGSDHSTCSAWSFLLDMAPAFWRREACSAGSAPYRASV